jgi:hypothetical protein
MWGGVIGPILRQIRQGQWADARFSTFEQRDRTARWVQPGNLDPAGAAI